jgi:Ser/Thr protein kinase RdoA (MazF antagonist)
MNSAMNNATNPATNNAMNNAANTVHEGSGPLPAPDGLAESEILMRHARTLLPAWSLDGDLPIALLNVSENTTFGIGDDLVLRIHRDGYSSLDEIASELAWLTAVRNDTGLSTPQVVVAASGEQIVPSHVEALGSDRYAVLFRRLPGCEPSDANLATLFEPLGAITARLHQHAKTWVRPPGFVRRVWDVEHAIGELGHWGHWRNGLGVGHSEREVLSRLAAQVTKRLGAFGSGPDRFGLIHADLRLANLLVTADGAISLLDFDDSGFSWFGYDLGSSLSFIEDHPERDVLIDSWCNGYRTIAPLEAEVVRELMTFVMLRRLILTAWFGTHSDIELAHTVGKTFAFGTCQLAEEFLSASG